MKNALLVIFLGALAAACTVREQTVVERPRPVPVATVVTADPPPTTVVVRER
jgi:hypothetical protein